MKISDRALESIILDVMHSMEELVTAKGMETNSDCFEILSIEPPEPNHCETAVLDPEEAIILPFPALRKTA